jgi:hypothetical protein
VLDAMLDRRMKEIDAKAAADKLGDVRIKGANLKITPLKAICQSARKRDHLSACKKNPFDTAVLACPGSEQEGPSRVSVWKN